MTSFVRLHLPLLLAAMVVPSCIQIHASENDDGSVSAVEGAETCDPIGMPLNHADLFTSGGSLDVPWSCEPTSCTMGLDGSVTFKYCLDCPMTGNAPWAVCTFATAHDMSRFDAASGGSGALALTLDVVREPGVETQGGSVGTLLFWYGEPDRRKYVDLSQYDENGLPYLPYGEQVIHLSPADACFPSYGSIDERCFGACGYDIDKVCEASFSWSPLTIAAEHCIRGMRFQGTVKVLDVECFQEKCACIDDADCDDERPRCRFADLPNPSCSHGEGLAEAPRCGGICAER